MPTAPVEAHGWFGSYKAQFGHPPNTATQLTTFVANQGGHLSYRSARQFLDSLAMSIAEIHEKPIFAASMERRGLQTASTSQGAVRQLLNCDSRFLADDSVALTLFPRNVGIGDAGRYALQDACAQTILPASTAASVHNADNGAAADCSFLPRSAWVALGLPSFKRSDDGNKDYGQTPAPTSENLESRSESAYLEGDIRKVDAADGRPGVDGLTRLRRRSSFGRPPLLPQDLSSRRVLRCLESDQQKDAWAACRDDLISRRHSDASTRSRSSDSSMSAHSRSNSQECVAPDLRMRQDLLAEAMRCVFKMSYAAQAAFMELDTMPLQNFLDACHTAHVLKLECGLDVVFHWTARHRVRSIAQQGLLVPDGINLQVVHGRKFGSGIYASPLYHYGNKYGDSCIMCLALPGIAYTRVQAFAKSAGAVCALYRNEVYVYKSSFQVLPFLHVGNVSDLSEVHAIATEVAEFLLTHFAGLRVTAHNL